MDAQVAVACQRQASYLATWAYHATCHNDLLEFQVMNACAMPGVQLVRMTPFRSYVAVIGAAVASIFARQLQLNNGMRTYISV